MTDPVLVEVERSGLVESRHCGRVVGLRSDGSVAFAVGDVGGAVYGRSASKPLQATAMVEAGLDLPDHLLAVVCASHSGEPRHVEAVRAILAGAGLDEAALRTPASMPLGERAAHQVLRAGGGPSTVLHNCSGKHAGMLATCVAAGWPVDDYLDPTHPLQRHLTDRIGDQAGEPVAHVGVDGCGAPVQALSLVGLARAFAAVAGAPDGSAAASVAAAMRAHPGMVGGEDRDVTALLVGIPGIVTKEGAEGVHAAALPDGRAVALKIGDGAWRARAAVLLAALERLGVDTGPVASLRTADVLGGGLPVGVLRTTPVWGAAN